MVRDEIALGPRQPRIRRQEALPLTILSKLDIGEHVKEVVIELYVPFEIRELFLQLIAHAIQVAKISLEEVGHMDPHAKTTPKVEGSRSHRIPQRYRGKGNNHFLFELLCVLFILMEPFYHDILSVNITMLEFQFVLEKGNDGIPEVRAVHWP